jgi:two-component system CheB/CheR fusion protein
LERPQGVAAFEAFFSGMPAVNDIEPGMSFVLVQHLASDHKSILPNWYNVLPACRFSR